ncbi:MAG: nucleotidyltransferase substrate binding protein [Oscillospiraceae bacterium]|jgi:nucleotidyltransferase substrate binding protein (TIGR01987 family)|nr:nucleotidyltransferase substrate binding protein [Oscillospiraceae bacterium]
MEKTTLKFQQLKYAYERLDEALKLKFPTPQTKIDTVVHRFEIITASLLVFLKMRLDSEAKIKVASPQEAISTARSLGIFPADERWSELIRDRNSVARSFSDENSAEIYSKIKNEYLAMIKDFIKNYATLRLLPKNHRQYLAKIKTSI